MVDKCFVDLLCFNMSSPNVSAVQFDIDELFSDIPDAEFLTATQLIESNVGCSPQCYNPVFSDISEDELIDAASLAEVVVRAGIESKSSCDYVESHTLGIQYFDYSGYDSVQED